MFQLYFHMHVNSFKFYKDASTWNKKLYLHYKRHNFWGGKLKECSYFTEVNKP